MKENDERFFFLLIFELVRNGLQVLASRCMNNITNVWCIAGQLAYAEYCSVIVMYLSDYPLKT